MKKNQTKNPYQSMHIEYHIIQSFPVTCLNRDDVGAPKTAMIGGTTRARVSSQCWKRQVRLTLRDLGIELGSRTKLIAELIATACKEKGATPDQAKACGEKVEHIFIKKKEDNKTANSGKTKKNDEDENGESGNDDKTDTLLFISPAEVKLLAEEFKQVQFKPDALFKQKDAKKQAKELADLIGKTDEQINALDIALFGRMVAQAATLNVEAASSFAHAISTHKVTNEVEFFTALDDESKEQGSAHMGSLEFNSATYYRYISLDIGQLWQTLAGQNIPESVEVFTKALYMAVPNARQTSQSGASPWEFARIFVRRGQRLQAPFETGVKAQNGGFLEQSINELCQYLDKKEKLAGSLFGKIKKVDFGKDEAFNIDKLIGEIKFGIAEGRAK
ncbi:type I-E CRISPR-associated protein Cas7/Cse4/CasC [bacterium]|nr:type I-E CRISPR-associated protein Cas7/Cse4/CasC [bacterium]